MADDDQLTTFLDARKPGAHLEDDFVPDDFVLMLGVDLRNFLKFPKAVADGVTFAKTQLDIRQEVDVELRRRARRLRRPYRPDLRFTDFSADALRTKVIPWSEAYLLVCVEGWVKEVGRRFGEEAMREIEWAAWTEQIAAELDRMRPSSCRRRGPTPIPTPAARSSTPSCSARTSSPDDLTKAELVRWFLEEPRYLLQCIEGWAAQIVVRHGLDEMFDIQFTLLGRDRAPPGEGAEGRLLGISGDTVEDWMKDLQMDATALPGKAFDLTFEMPEPDVGIADVQPLRRRRPMGGHGPARHPREELPLDVPEVDDRHDQDVQPEHEGRHPPPSHPGSRRATCCCRWRFSMRDEHDPEYVPVTLGTKPA